MSYYSDSYDDYYDDRASDYDDYIASRAEDGEAFCADHGFYDAGEESDDDDDDESESGCPKCSARAEMYARIEAGEADADSICFACQSEVSETSFMGQRVCRACYEAIATGKVQTDRLVFANPGGHSALRAAGPGNPRVHPCPTCMEPNVLTPQDVQRGYQCDTCADRAEGRYFGGDY